VYSNLQREGVMMRAKHVRLVALGILVVWTTAVFGDEKTAATPDANGAKTEAAKKTHKIKGKPADQPSGRLPIYFAKVVDDKQKVAIYRIQHEYDSKIADLKTQLAQVTKQRDEKIAAVLTPEQQKKIDEAKAAAAKSRPASSSAAKSKVDAPTASATPAAPAAPPAAK
jgi:hypothetical protein